jgi:hypothetical protein
MVGQCKPRILFAVLHHSLSLAVANKTFSNLELHQYRDWIGDEHDVEKVHEQVGGD